MKIYTRTGDDGTTSLPGGKRVPKNHIRIDAYGSMDELISWIGLLRSCEENVKRKDFLIFIQDQLMKCTAALSSDSGNRKCLPDDNSVLSLENEIDKMEETLPPLEIFILPGGKLPVSYCHIARSVCRRAERTMLKLNQTEKTPEIVNKFLNRLSDYLFVLARKISFELDNEDVKWTF